MPCGRARLLPPQSAGASPSFRLMTITNVVGRRGEIRSSLQLPGSGRRPDHYKGLTGDQCRADREQKPAQAKDPLIQTQPFRVELVLAEEGFPLPQLVRVLGKLRRQGEWGDHRQIDPPPLERGPDRPGKGRPVERKTPG